MPKTPKVVIPEKVVQKSIIKYLADNGLYAWRNNSGVLPNPKGRPIRFGKVGSSDVFCILPPNGRLFTIECKREGNEPTVEQWNFMTEVKIAGGLAIVAYSIDDVRKALRDAGYNAF